MVYFRIHLDICIEFPAGKSVIMPPKPYVDGALEDDGCSNSQGLAKISTGTALNVYH